MGHDSIKHYTYNVLSVICLLHAAFLSLVPWVQIGPHTNSFNETFYMGIWPLLLLIWPAWLVIMPVLVYAGDRKWKRLFAPLVLGPMVLVPAVFYLWMMIKIMGLGPIR